MKGAGWRREVYGDNYMEKWVYSCVTGNNYTEKRVFGWVKRSKEEKWRREMCGDNYQEKWVHGSVWCLHNVQFGERYTNWDLPSLSPTFIERLSNLSLNSSSKGLQEKKKRKWMSDVKDNSRAGETYSKSKQEQAGTSESKQELSTCRRLAKDEKMAGGPFRCQMKHEFRHCPHARSNWRPYVWAVLGWSTWR